jgi:hypothetical protein
MLKIFPFERFEEIEMSEPKKLRYAISNHGRLLSFKNNFADGRILNGSLIDGYRIFRYKIFEDGKIIARKHFFFARLVATYFLPKTSEDQTFVLHLDRQRDNDHHTNLQWATKAEMMEHSRKSPYVIDAKAKISDSNRSFNSKNQKLKVSEVIMLRRTLLSPNRKTRLKILAKQFGVSEMQLQRIRTGENWKDVKV